MGEVNPNNHKLAIFYRREKSTFVISRIFLGLSILFGSILIVINVKYNALNETRGYHLLVSALCYSLIMAIISIAIHINRPRYCPKCGMKMNKIVILNKNIKYRCTQCGFEVDTHEAHTISG